TILSRPRSTLFPYTTLFRSQLVGTEKNLLYPCFACKRVAYNGVSLHVLFRLSSSQELCTICMCSVSTICMCSVSTIRNPGIFVLDRKSTRLNSSHVKISYAV